MRSTESILEEVRAIAEVYPAGSGHFVYTSDMHGDGYVDYRPLGAKKIHHPLLREVCIKLLTETIKRAHLDNSHKIVVVGPETMGATMVDRLREADGAGQLSLASLCTIKLLKDKTSATGFRWEVDAYEKLQAAQIIVMDDLLNMSSTLGKIQTMIGMCNQQIQAVAVIGDRCNVTAQQMGVKVITSLEEFPGFTVHSPEVCSMCMAKLPIIRRPGHGHSFQKTHADYPGGFIDQPVR